MVEAPEKIWACPRGKKCVVSFTTPSLEYNVEYVRSDLYAALEALLAERVKVEDVLDAASEYMKTQYGIGALSHPTDRGRILSALEATPPAPKVTECATEGCAQTATVRFERGGVGSDYCHGCYMRIQTLTAAQEAPKVTKLSYCQYPKCHCAIKCDETLTAAQEAGKP